MEKRAVIDPEITPDTEQPTQTKSSGCCKSSCGCKSVEELDNDMTKKFAAAIAADEVIPFKLITDAPNDGHSINS